MLDIKLIRENPDIVRKDLKKRGDAEKQRLLEELIEKDKKSRAVTTELNDLRAKRNKLSEEIAALKRAGKDAKTKLKEAGELPELVKAKEVEQRASEERVKWLLMRLPNVLHESVPVGKDDSENVEIGKWGKIPKFKFEPKDHIDLGVPLGLFDLERAAKIAGARFYFLKNDLVTLNFALIAYGLDFIRKRGFTVLEPPFMITRKAYEGVTDLADFESVIYKIEGEDLHLIATSEHPMISMRMDETLLRDELPIPAAGISPCFRKEAGAHGKDTKGIFRVHQFDKVEQTVICAPEESWKWFEVLAKNSHDFFQSLDIPYRVVNVCTGDIGIIAAKKFDFEGWFAKQGTYRELGSCSNVTDYQARRLNIRFRNKEGEAPAGFVHTLNNTLVACQRTLACILELNQREDGSIAVPKVLQKHSGLKEIVAQKAKKK
jgi:seryl-tRNA synthetase